MNPSTRSLEQGLHAAHHSDADLSADLHAAALVATHCPRHLTLVVIGPASCILERRKA